MTRPLTGELVYANVLHMVYTNSLLRLPVARDRNHRENRTVDLILDAAAGPWVTVRRWCAGRRPESGRTDDDSCRSPVVAVPLAHRSLRKSERSS